MDLLTLFTTAFIVGFSGALMPGPLLTVTISESIRKGAKSGPLLILGHGILEFSLVIALIFGLGKWLSQPLVTGIIALVGGSFLLWMGYGMVRDVRLGKVTLKTETEATNSEAGEGTNSEVNQAKKMGPIKAGIFTSFANPYWSLWWATIGLGFIVQALKFGILGVAVFFLGHILADLTWYTAISFAVSKGKNLISQRIYNGVIALCGVFLIGLAGYFIYSGLKFF